MNERIKELAEQADAFADAMDIGGKNYIGLRDTYFAELIVRDCALTAGLMEHEGRNGIGAQLLDNFGIAE
jgi:hypothetical protein